MCDLRGVGRHMILLAILFILHAPAGFLTDDTRTLLRALARATGCQTPIIAGEMRDGQTMEITVSCRTPGEDDP